MTSAMLALEVVDAARLTVHPENPRRGDIDAIAASLDAHGQFSPIVVQRSTGTILAGNHTFMAATERLGWDRVSVVWVDVDDDRARRILLAANRASDLGRYDDRVLRELLSDLAGSDQGLADTGYTADDLASLEAIASTGADSLRDAVDSLGEPAFDELWPTLEMKVPPHVRTAFYEQTDAAADRTDLGRLQYLLAAAGWNEAGDS